MAGFDINHFQKWSASSAFGNNNMWQYTSSTDTLATIEAADYFDDLMTSLDGPLLVNDIIWLQGTDGQEFATITAITPHVTVDPFSVTLGAGSVGTSNIADLAVTAAKIAANTITDGEVEVNGLTSASLALNTIQYAQVSLTAAQIKALYDTPIKIITAGGANTAIVIDRIWCSFTFVSAQYTAGGALGLQWGNTVHGGGPAASTTLAAATLNGYAASNAFELTPDGTDTLANIVNKDVYISNATADFATGDSTMKVNVAYRIVATA